MNIYIYDIETFPNVFTITFFDVNKKLCTTFEISFRKNQAVFLFDYLREIKLSNGFMVGYNNVGFDYPVLHLIMSYSPAQVTYDLIYDKAMSLINTEWNNRFGSIIWDPTIDQIDLMKVHHFDNAARSTSLKILEINMGMEDVRELPFDPGTVLTSNQIDELIKYNIHDVRATFDFYKLTIDEIAFRESLFDKYQLKALNFSDSKIGTEIFIKSLEESGIPCFEKQGRRKKARQTIRDNINLKECVLDYIQFNNTEFNRILNFFKSKSITETKGVFNNLQCEVEGMEYIFGTGGLHASLNDTLIKSSSTLLIVDVDVKSYYPNLAIKNKIYPEHLGEEFCLIYEKLYNQRNSYAKKTPENAALKIALNGTYGNSGNVYSPFYDLKYLLTITISGQLSLLMLVDMLIELPTLNIIQCNTDGVTYSVHPDYSNTARKICKEWEQITALELEEAIYSRFWIRDVNNYIAEYANGDLKRKGAFRFGDELGWHQNHSSQVVAKAVSAYLVHGDNISAFIRSHSKRYDFMLNVKIPKNSKLYIGDIQTSNILRYYMSEEGDYLTKVMPAKGPVGEYKRANKLTDEYYETIKAEAGSNWDARINTKNKSVYEERSMSIQSGYKVLPCMRASLLQPNLINYQFYIDQAYKLIDMVINVIDHQEK